MLEYCKLNNEQNQTTKFFVDWNEYWWKLFVDWNEYWWKLDYYFAKHYQNQKKNDFLFKHMCFSHLKILSDHVGFQIKNLKFKDLKKRLQQCWIHWNNLKTFKSKKSIHNWWRFKHWFWTWKNDQRIFVHKSYKIILNHLLMT